MGDNSDVVATGASKGAVVANALLHAACDGTLGHLAQGQHVANDEVG